MISEFRGVHRFLSNFWPVEIRFEGVEYPTVEHAYQAAKTNDLYFRKLIQGCLTPGQAKRMGGKVPIRSDWEKIKDKVMLRLLREKFKHMALKELLLGTGECRLVEGNTWGDTYWGVCNGKGKNQLGNLLMYVREEVAKRLKGKS